MKVKRMVKRLFAVGTGAAMLGATAMGALAADLKDYPGMFVTDGTFNGFFVVGEKAASVDNLAMTDIAAGMKYVKAAGTGTTTTVTGDAWLVGTSSKKFEFSNSNASDSSIGGETFRDINTFIGEDELKALGDGKWSTNENEYAFQQYLFFDVEGATPERNRIVKYAENDDDVTADHLFFQNSRQIARYRLEFSSNAQSDVTDAAGAADTTGTYLDDFEDTTLSLMGRAYTIVQARRTDNGADVNQNGIKLILMSGAKADTLLEGESKTYTVGSKTYDVTLAYVDSDEAKFTINGEATNKLKDGDTYVLSDKSEVGVSEILYQDYAGGIHSATFFLGARKLEVRDDDVSNVASSHRLKVGSEDIDGADVIVEGSDTNTTFTVSRISVNMTAQDDYFVAKDGKLSDRITADGEEKEVLMDGGFEIEYKGLSTEKVKDIRLKTSSAKRYKLQLYDGDGNAVDLPVAYATASQNLSMGEEDYTGTRTNQKRLIINESLVVAKDDYFTVTGGTAGDGSAKSYLLKYTGSDRQDKTSPKIKFKNAGNGETLEYAVTSVSVGTTGTVATIKVGGYSFIAQNASPTSADDFDLRVDLPGDGTVSGPATPGGETAFVDYYGSQWAIYDNSSDNSSGLLDRMDPVKAAKQMVCINETGNDAAVCQDTIRVTQTTPNGDDYDNVIPSTLTLDITATSGPEVRASLSGVTLVTPDGETEVSYGYTSMGSFLKFQSPSNDPQELTLTYPEKQRLPQVYITSGATTSATSAASGDLAKVEVVDATKLDNEIADVNAQNLVVVGGPCVNTVAAELLGNPTDCTEGFTPGKARVKLFTSGDKVAMLVAGYSGADTRLAGKVIAHRWKEFSGSEVEVEGTTYSDATIGAPAPKVAMTEAATTTE